MSFRSTSSFGKRLEFVAISELLRRGYDVYQTLVDDQGIDCIIRKTIDGAPYYVDVQIKARSKNCIPIDAARFAAMEIPNPRQNFVFMFYSEWLNTWWLIPSLDLVNGLASKNNKGKNAGKWHVLFSGIQNGVPTIKERFDKYRQESGFNVLDGIFETVKNRDRSK